MILRLILKLSILSSVFIHNLSLAYSFDEKLSVNLLSDSNAYFFFEFKSIWSNTKLNTVENYDLFPKRIGDLVSKFDIDFLIVALSNLKVIYVNGSS